MSLLNTARLPVELPDQLQRIDRFWHSYRNEPQIAKEVVILIGTALQLQGWRVAIVEQGQLQGRAQEWNVSRRELGILLELDLLTEEELERAIATEYNPARVGFHGGVELWVKDILNIGVDPMFLLATLKARFLGAGGQLLEQTGWAVAALRGSATQRSIVVGYDGSLFADRSPGPPAYPGFPHPRRSLHGGGGLRPRFT
jgi:lycopene cyclase CruP